MGFRTIIAGSRTIDDYSTVRAAIESAPFEIDVVISGKARGVDTLGERWAAEQGVPVDPYPYDEYDDESGKPAPLIRNEVMAGKADALIAVWNGDSNGTQHMIDCAKDEELCLHIVRTDTTRLDEF